MTNRYLKVDLISQGVAEHFQLASFLPVLPQHDFLKEEPHEFQGSSNCKRVAGGAQHADTATAGTAGEVQCAHIQNKYMCVLCLALHFGEQSQMDATFKEQEVLNRVIRRSADETPRLYHWNINTQQNHREQGKDNSSQGRNTIWNTFISTL